VTGFNPVTREYLYAVNTHLGQPSANQSFGNPFVFVLGARMNIGPSDAEQQLRGLFGAGRGGGGGGGGPAGGPAGRLGRVRARARGREAGGGAEQRQTFADEIATRLEQRITIPTVLSSRSRKALSLTPDQVTQLEASSQTFQLRVDSIANAGPRRPEKAGREHRLRNDGWDHPAPLYNRSAISRAPRSPICKRRSPPSNGSTSPTRFKGVR